ncbi:hypothetical protein SCLCIDRAFT_127049, partial [Scleroderma citrinum Foug A]
PVFCTSCCRTQHNLLPLHRIEQWNGMFFQESSLRQAGLVVHLGHRGKPCLAGGYQDRGVPNDFEEDWEDLEEHAGPPHLTAPKDRSCLTVVHTSGVHFCDVRYCNCPGSKDSHLQLACANLFPATTKQPRTAFTFQMLDEFIQDNVECGTSAMNFYSKLRRNTSNAFPHLVPDRYQEMLQVSRIWRLLKLMKWQGFHEGSPDPGSGKLVLFCPACPQPGVNISTDEDINLSKYIVVLFTKCAPADQSGKLEIF